MGTAQTPASLATENPEGDDLIVAKAECPPQTPPFWPRLAHQDRTVLTLTVWAVSLARKARQLELVIAVLPASTPKAWRRRASSMIK